MKNATLILIFFCSTLAAASGAEHSASPGHEPIPLKLIGWQAANLGILLIALFFFIRKSIVEAFQNRQKEYLDRAEKTKSALKDAEAALVGIKRKLAELEADEKMSYEKAQHEAGLLRVNLMREADAGAEKIKKEAGLTIRNELNKAKAEINSEILNQAVAEAKKTLTIINQTNSSAQEASFVKQLEQVRA